MKFDWPNNLTEPIKSRLTFCVRVRRHCKIDLLGLISLVLFQDSNCYDFQLLNDGRETKCSTLYDVNGDTHEVIEC